MDRLNSPQEQHYQANMAQWAQPPSLRHLGHIETLKWAQLRLERHPTKCTQIVSKYVG